MLWHAPIRQLPSRFPYDSPRAGEWLFRPGRVDLDYRYGHDTRRDALFSAHWLLTPHPVRTRPKNATMSCASN
jgi:hypothetical protein